MDQRGPRLTADHGYDSRSRPADPPGGCARTGGSPATSRSGLTSTATALSRAAPRSPPTTDAIPLPPTEALPVEDCHTSHHTLNHQRSSFPDTRAAERRCPAERRPATRKPSTRSRRPAGAVAARLARSSGGAARGHWPGRRGDEGLDGRQDAAGRRRGWRSAWCSRPLLACCLPGTPAMSVMSQLHIEV